MSQTGSSSVKELFGTSGRCSVAYGPKPKKGGEGKKEADVIAQEKGRGKQGEKTGEHIFRGSHERGKNGIVCWMHAKLKSLTTTGKGDDSEEKKGHASRPHRQKVGGRGRGFDFERSAPERWNGATSSRAARSAPYFTPRRSSRGKSPLGPTEGKIPTEGWRSKGQRKRGTNFGVTQVPAQIRAAGRLDILVKSRSRVGVSGSYAMANHPKGAAPSKGAKTPPKTIRGGKQKAQRRDDSGEREKPVLSKERSSSRRAWSKGSPDIGHSKRRMGTVRQEE